MSSETRRPQCLRAPIFKLDQYLLWLTFSTIADMDMDLSYASRNCQRDLHPLTVLRWCSQVCSSWRAVLLESPSLWGQLIDIEALLWSHDTWRREVLARTGQSMLHVTGCVRFDPTNEPWKGTGEYFLSILNEFWPRIRRLRVEVMEVGVQSEEKALKRWRVLQQPAPNLEVFNVHFGLNSLSSNLFATEGSHLFSDNSPYLRHFVATNIHFQLSAPCFFHLKSLRLSSHFTVPQILEAFSSMDSLESLTVDSLSAPRGGDLPLPYITLPSLSDIRVVGPTKACMLLLDHVVASPACRVYFEASGEGHFPVRSSETTLRVLERYAKNYTQTHNVATLSINMTLSSFTFSANTVSTFNVPPSANFIFKCDTSPDAYPLLVSALSQCTFGSAKTLHFNVKGISTSDFDFTKLFQSLTSIEVAELTSDGMDLIFTTMSQECTDSGILFPALKTIRMAPFISSSDTDVILPFLRLRQNLGVPTEVFDLELHPLAGFPINFSFLDEVDGLRVIWKCGEESRSYVCGSGIPEELDFKYDPIQLIYDIRRL